MTAPEKEMEEEDEEVQEVQGEEDPEVVEVEDVVALEEEGGEIQGQGHVEGLSELKCQEKN